MSMSRDRVCVLGQSVLESSGIKIVLNSTGRIFDSLYIFRPLTKRREPIRNINNKLILFFTFDYCNNTFINNYYPFCLMLLFLFIDTFESAYFDLRNCGSHVHKVEDAIVICGKTQDLWMDSSRNKCIFRMPSFPKIQLKAQRNTTGRARCSRRVTDSRNYKFRRRLAHVCLLF